MSKYFIFFLFSFFFLFCNSQNLTVDLQNTRDLFTKNTDLSIDIEVFSYTNELDKGTKIGVALLRKSGDLYYSKFLKDEMILTNNSLIIIDHRLKKVKFSEIKDKSMRFNFLKVNIDSVVNQSDSILYLGIFNNEKKYQFLSTQSVYDKVELNLDSQSNLLKSITCFYNKGDENMDFTLYKTQLNYLKIDTLTKNQSYFLEENYVVKNKDRYVLSDKYNTYVLQIVDSKLLPLR